MSTLGDVLKIATLGVKLLGSGLALLGKPLRVVLPKPLKGPFHVYPPPGTPAWQFAPHTCIHCPRYDQAETPYTDPPCPRTKR